MFSIIIPLYNKGTYIEKAIKSVSVQTFQEFELIVVDDGSTDNSLENLRFTIYDLQLSEEKILIVEQQNQGVSMARNNGVKLAKYDYIAFLDADDWWEPTYLEEMKGLIDTYPEAALYGSSYFKVLPDRLVPANIGVEKGFESGIINYCRVYAKTMYQPIWTGAAIIKRIIFEEENGFNQILKLGEDFDLWIRVAMKYPVALLNKPLAYYNQVVDIDNRAIGEKIYKPEENMLFTDYGKWMNDPDFRQMYEVLALYGLMKYYTADEYKKDINKILNTIQWDNHPRKYKIYYKLLSPALVKWWFSLLKLGSNIKKLF